MIRYSLQVDDHVNIERVREVARSIGPQVENAVMTAAEKLIAEGLEQGLKKGRQEGLLKGRRETLIQLMTLKFQALSPQILTKIEEASSETLTVWTQRVLDAQTPEDVFYYSADQSG